MTSGSRGWSRFGSLAVARAALAVVALALIAVACTQASAQTPTPSPFPIVDATLSPSNCTVTTTISKPTGLTLTANPSNYRTSGILLSWDAPPAADEVRHYEIFRRIAPDETELSLYIALDLTYADTVPTSQFDDGIEDGNRYVYRIVAQRVDNCGSLQNSAQSASASLTYTAPTQGDGQIGGV